MNKRSERGSVIEIVIIIVLALVVIGLLAWRFVDSNKRTSDNANSSTQTTQSTDTKNGEQSSSGEQADSNKGYIVLEDWGVRFKPSDDGLYNYYKESGASYAFTTSVSEGLGKYCKPTDGWVALGHVNRFAEKPTVDELGGYQELLNSGNKINGYYYYYESPEATCSDNGAGAETELGQVKLVKELIQSIQVKQ